MGRIQLEAKPDIRQQGIGTDDSFDTATVLTLAAAHMGHDLYTAFLGPLLPQLISKLSIPLAGAGVLATCLRVGSLAQPFTGLWADRSDTRYFVIAAPTITAICMSSLGIAPNYLSLVVLLLIAGLSHGSFHPAAAATVTRASGRTWGKGTAIHLTGGKLGFAIGPMFIAFMVTWVGLEGSSLAAIPGVVFSVLLYLRLKDRAAPQLSRKSSSRVWRDVKGQGRVLLFLSGFVLFRSVTTVSLSTFYPTFLTDAGSSLLYAGLAMSVYQLAGAGGSLVGGILSDLMGRRGMMLVSQLVAVPFLYLALLLPAGLGALAALVVGGAMISAASPIQLNIFQELLPGSRSTAAGIWSFVSFEGSLVTAVVVGAVGDWFGLGAALTISIFAGLLSLPFLLAIPETRRSA